MPLPSDPYYVLHVIWTEEEKIQLLEALQKYGTDDIAKLASEIPTKTPLEIAHCLGLYKMRANQQREAKKNEVSKTPIDLWMDYLKHEEQENNKQAARDLATAFKFLALYEKHTDMDDVVLRDCYLFLSDVAAGKPPKKHNDESMHFLMEIFAKLTADMDKQDNSEIKKFIQNLKTEDIQKRTYVSKKASAANDPDLNLLKVPTELLQLNKEK